MRPDIHLVSEATKNILIMELMGEDSLWEAHERKRTKYNLVISCQEQGWKVRCMSIEVGSRGFVGQSFHRALNWASQEDQGPELSITSLKQRRKP